MNKTIALVLAGGQGKRMDILCHLTPKPALPFAGCFRVIDFSLSNCLNSGIRNIAVLTDYRRRNMADYLNRWKDTNADSMAFEILEPQKSYRGTADAVYQNLDYLRNSDADTVLVLAGDHIYKMDYRKIVKFHRQNRADVTIGVVQVPVEETYRFGTVKLNKDKSVGEFVEKSANSTSNLASMGIYVFNKEVLIERLIDDSFNIESEHDFGYSILPAMVNRDRVFAYLFDGYWQDIGTKEAYFQANMELLRTEPLLSLNSWHTVLTEKHEFPTMMEPGQGTIINSLVSPSCKIKGHVENSILSPGVTVEQGAKVLNSVVMADSFIGSNSIIDRCILSGGTDIDRYCYIGFGGREDTGLTLLGDRARIPPHTAIGRNCKILPYADAEDFKGKAVPANSIIPEPKIKATNPVKTNKDEAMV